MYQTFIETLVATVVHIFNLIKANKIFLDGFVLNSACVTQCYTASVKVI